MRVSACVRVSVQLRLFSSPQERGGPLSLVGERVSVGDVRSKESASVVRRLFSCASQTMGCGASQQEPTPAAKRKSKDEGRQRPPPKEREAQYAETAPVPADMKRTTSSVVLAGNNRKVTSSSKTPDPLSVYRNQRDSTSDTSSNSSSSSPIQVGVSTRPSALLAKDFVFGDFVVDPADVQRQRVERLNRVRPSPGSRLNGEASLVASPRASTSSKYFTMNDFHVAIDDAEQYPDAFGIPQTRVNSTVTFLSTTAGDLRGFTVHPLVGHSTRIKVAVLNPKDGAECISAALEDTALTLSDPATGRVLHKLSGHALPVLSCTFSKDGALLATSSRDSSVIVWDMSGTRDSRTTKRQLATLEHPCLPVCVTFSHDSLFVISGGQDKVCRVWSVASGHLIGRFVGHSALVVCISGHPRRPYVASSGGDRSVFLWLGRPPKLLTEASPADASHQDGCEFEVDADFFAQGGALSSDQLHATSGAAANGGSTLTSPRGMPDDGCLGAATAVELPCYAKLTGHEGVVISVCFNRDGTKLLSNDDRRCRVWSIVLPSEPGSRLHSPPRSPNSPSPAPALTPVGATVLLSINLLNPMRGCAAILDVTLQSLTGVGLDEGSHRSTPGRLPDSFFENKIRPIRDAQGKRAQELAAIRAAWPQRRKKSVIQSEAELSGSASPKNSAGKAPMAANGGDPPAEVPSLTLTELRTHIGHKETSIISPSSLKASSIASQRCVFTLSCFAPESLERSYFVVAATNRQVYFVSLSSGQEEISFAVRSAVFALSAASRRLLLGDIYGNMYRVELAKAQKAAHHRGVSPLTR